MTKALAMKLLKILNQPAVVLAALAIVLAVLFAVAGIWMTLAAGSMFSAGFLYARRLQDPR